MNANVNRTPAQRTTLLLAMLLLAALALGGCGRSATPVPPAPPPEPSPVVEPTVEPTPLPAILRVPLQPYQAPEGAFTLLVPETWSAFEIPGGVRFAEDEESITGVTAHFQPLPLTVDPESYIASIIATTFDVVRFNEAESFQALHREQTLDGHHRVEYIGRINPDRPLARVLAELWTESGTLLGLSLTGPAQTWHEVEPLWPLLVQSYVPGDVEAALRAFEVVYIHASGHFSITVPVAWGLVDETADGVILGDESGQAQFSIATTEFDRQPTPEEMDATLSALVGSLAEDPMYLELARSAPAPLERVLQFEPPPGDDGFYRTELRLFAASNVLYTLSFSVPPHDWDLYLPAYEFLLASLTFGDSLPPPEEVLEADGLAGIVVGETLTYMASGGALWVSAPIHNRRNRNLDDITAAVKLYDAEENLLAAESWRLQQRVVPAGGVTYLTMRIPPEVAPVAQASYALVEIVDANDTDAQAFQPWGYVGGAAEVNSAGDVVLSVTMRNASNDIRRFIYLVGLLYDAEGRLVFARGETMRLPYAVPPGEEVDLRLTVWGPFTDLASFDVIGEVPK